MNIKYFKDTDTLYIELRERPVTQTRDLDGHRALATGTKSGGMRCCWPPRPARTR